MIYMFLVFLLIFIYGNYKFVVFSIKNQNYINKFDNKIKSVKGWFFSQGIYALFYKYLPVKSKKIMFESHLGEDMGGNPYYILLEVLKNEKYKGFNVFVVGDKNKIFQKKSLKGKKIKVIKYNSISYFYHLATAGYLINDVTFKRFFIKRPEQKYLNTWHGTPLKAMGRRIEYSPVFLSNTQRNFLHADLLLAPNEHVLNMYKHDYMLDGICNKDIALTGYPRNEVFFTDYSDIKNDLGLNNKNIIAYMPTGRGGDDVLNNIYLAYEMERNLKFLESNLTNDQVLYVKLHPLAATNINLETFSRIRPFPLEYETYEFLSQADVLITDYSSVLFDFATVNKKIILFCDDYEEYKKERGFSLDYFKDIPFVKVTKKEALLNEINNLEKTAEEEKAYTIFKNTFCTYDSAGVTKELCDSFIFGGSDCNSVKLKKHNSLTLLYTGQFLRNGITTSLLNLLSNIDLEEVKIVCNFNQSITPRDSFDTIVNLPDSVAYIPNKGRMLLTPIERLFLYLRLKGVFVNKWSEELENNVFLRESKRLYSDVKFDNIIHFSGYDRKPCLMYGVMEGNKTIFVHNDMELELKNKRNYSPYGVFSAWKKFDKIAIVRDSLYKSCINVLPEVKSKIKTVHNTINFKYSSLMSTLPLNTLVNKEMEALLNDPKTKKIITIGRFSSEKGHLRLIDAFETVAKHNSLIHLFIMGGYGELYDETVARQEVSDYSERIHILSNVKNPYPILKLMDGFILSSYYEGLPMVFFESLLMGVPIVSVDIDGPSEFLNKGYGKVVDNNLKGLESGIRYLLSDKVAEVKLDKLNDFNDAAINEFYSILNLSDK